MLCAGTAPRASFRERVEAASAAGFQAVSLFPTDVERARAEGTTEAAMRALLADHALAVAELDPLLRWIPGTEPGGLTAEGAAFARWEAPAFLALAESLGARSVNAVCVAEPSPSHGRVVEAFAALCERAAGHGLLVHLEFLPWTNVPDLAAALAIVEEAGAANGGVTLDAWQHARSHADAEALARAPGARILCVQLADAPREPEPDPVQETLHRRLLPGEGDLDLVGIVRTLDSIGSTAPIGIEVFSDVVGALPANEAARRSERALRGVLSRARPA